MRYCRDRRQVPGGRHAGRHVLRRRRRAPTNFVEAKTTDERVYRTFFHAMLAEGIALAPGAYEALFVGLAHTTTCWTRSARLPDAPRPPPPLSSADLTSPPMRQFVSSRFWLSIAALIGLTYGLWYVLVRKDDSVAVLGQPEEATASEHRVNLLLPVYGIQADPGFAMVDGAASGEMRPGARCDADDGGQVRHSRRDHLRQARRDQPVHRRGRSARRRRGVVLA